MYIWNVTVLYSSPSVEAQRETWNVNASNFTAAMECVMELVRLRLPAGIDIATINVSTLHSRRMF